MLLDRLEMSNPIILAPMGGGPSTPELAAAVSNAGGLGSLAAAYLSPAQIADACGAVRTLTDRPFAVNLFAGGYHGGPYVDPARMTTILAEVHEKLGLPRPVLPDTLSDPFPDQFEAVLAARPAAFSFTFGIPDIDRMLRLRAAGIFTMGTATTVDEARMLKAAGVDAIVAQGAEAGAHRGTFAGPSEEAMVPMVDLVEGVSASVGLPVIASGGIMDGRDIARALNAGAAAVQMGTAFLACPESGASPTYKQELLAAAEDSTVITRAYSGRPARGLRNTFIEMLDKEPDAILPYPVQNAYTRAMRTAAARIGEAGYLSLWAGTGVPRIRVMPAAELVQYLVEEMNEAIL